MELLTLLQGNSRVIEETSKHLAISQPLNFLNYKMEIKILITQHAGRTKRNRMVKALDV